MWSFSGPTPRPSRISMVMERDTTSLEARSLAVGAYLRGNKRGEELCWWPAIVVGLGAPWCNEQNSVRQVAYRESQPGQPHGNTFQQHPTYKQGYLA